MRRGPAASGAVALTLALTCCAPAFAATARVETVNAGRVNATLQLVYQADPGEANAVSIGIDPDGWYRIHDPGAAIAAGARCEADGADVRCFAGRVEVRTDDLDDSVSAVAGAAVERVSGGAGDDVLELPADNPVLEPRLMGGDGDDVLRATAAASALLEGDAGDDELGGGQGGDTLDGGPGSDRMAGGGGADTVTNASRGDGVTVDLSQGYASGADGERDALSEIENARGGTGDDVLTGDDRPNAIAGGPGADAIHGGGGGDDLTGDEGADAVSGDAGNDSLFGGSDFSGDTSPNALSGGSGRDALVGGGRRDVLDGGPGGDWLLGLGGRDVFAGRDGELDWVRCGSRDRSQVLLDVHDYVEHCGRVSRTRPARGLFVYGLLSARRYDLGLACPEDAARGCSGTYRLLYRGGRTHAERWRLKAGQSVEDVYFRTPLTPREGRALRRTPAASVAVLLVTRDARGRRVSSTVPFPGPPVASWPDYAFGTRCDGCPPDG